MRCETRTCTVKLKQQDTVRPKLQSKEFLQESSVTHITFFFLSSFELFKCDELRLTAVASSSVCAECVSVCVPLLLFPLMRLHKVVDRSSLHMILLGLRALWADTASALTGSSEPLPVDASPLPHSTTVTPRRLPSLLTVRPPIETLYSEVKQDKMRAFCSE